MQNESVFVLPHATKKQRAIQEGRCDLRQGQGTAPPRGSISGSSIVVTSNVSNSKRFVCPINGCIREFSTSNQKKKHMREVHPVDTEILKTTSTTYLRESKFTADKICFDFQSGICTRGDICRFGHFVNQTTTTKDSTILNSTTYLKEEIIHRPETSTDTTMTIDVPRCSVSSENAFAELETVTTPSNILLLLQLVVEPSKEALIAEIYKLVKRMIGGSGKLLRAYKFEERGSLFSPLVAHISDADVQLFSKMSVIPKSHCEYIVQFAQKNFYQHHIHSVRWETINGEKCEVPFSDFSWAVSLRGQADVSAFILTGFYCFPGGFLVPVDIALSCSAEKSEPKAQRCAKMIEKLREGDFAKVLQKIRALFRKGDSRDRLLESINSCTGTLRFVVKQLDMVRKILLIDNPSSMNSFIPPQTTSSSSTLSEGLDYSALGAAPVMSAYLHGTLKIRPDVAPLRDVPSLLTQCERELQRRALTIMQKHYDIIAPKFSGRGVALDELLFIDESKYTAL